MDAEMLHPSAEPISKIVHLNVGGAFFATSLDTLTRRQDTMLASMFSGRHPLLKDGSGRYFIDRDGAMFNYILNFLRDGEVDLPREHHALSRIRREARYYGLTELDQIITAQLGDAVPKPKPQEEDSPAVVVTWTFGFTGTYVSGTPSFKSDNMDVLIRQYDESGYKLVGVTRWPETTHSRAGQQLIFRQKSRK